MRGKTVVFEGPEGCGKTTQAKKALYYIRKNRKKAVLLREPGGTVISEKIRDILLSTSSKNMAPETEFLLYEAARAQVCREKIEKYLKKGYTVLLDRFFLATVVYQGYARGIEKNLIKRLNSYTAGRVKPDLTFVYDVSAKKAADRMKNRGKKDRMEKESLKFHNKVRAGYLKEARKMKKCVIINTDNNDTDGVFNSTVKELKRRRIIN